MFCFFFPPKMGAGKPRSTASGMPWFRAYGVPEEYVQRVIDTAILTNTALPKSSPNRSG
jgi:hypothetical protein